MAAVVGSTVPHRSKFLQACPQRATTEAPALYKPWMDQYIAGNKLWVAIWVPALCLPLYRRQPASAIGMTRSSRAHAIDWDLWHGPVIQLPGGRGWWMA